jgi:crotonobetainyl-CoA:carnitine CoA-transferase CaiB-like acyl-CoA transferase
MVTQVPREDGSLQPQIACPVKFSAGLPPPRHIGVAAGLHSDLVLREAGFSDQDIAALRQAGALGP